MSSITPKPGMTVEISMQGIEKSRLDAIESAEAQRKADEAERAAAEVMRKEEETGRITAEQERALEEYARELAENGRMLAEESRVNAENQRAADEQSRVDAEKGRSVAEANRANAENQRVEAEKLRENAEDARVAEETDRANAEALRQQTFETNEANRQTAYESAENARESEWVEIKSDVESSAGSAVASASAATDAANTAADNANAAAEKSVRYDEAQTLSDAQKAQARGNIDAAGANEVAEMRGDLSVLKEFTYGKHAYGENIVRKTKTYQAGTILNQTSFSVTFNRDDIGASDSMIVLDCLGYISAQVEANEIDLENISHTFRFQCAGIPWGVGMSITTDWGSKAWYYDSRRETIKGYTNENPPGTDTHLIQIRTIQRDYTTTGPVTITYTAHRLYANGI